MSENNLTVGGKYITVGGKALSYVSDYDPYNPLGLPSYTARVQFADGVTPAYRSGHEVTLSQVSSSPNVWDVTYSDPDWSFMFQSVNGWLENFSYITKFLGANTTGVTNMSYMFGQQYYLTEVGLFDTSSVTSMDGMFSNCPLLSTVPTYNTSNVTDMTCMFLSCSALTALPQYNTSKVTEMEGICYGCTSLASVPLIDTSKVKNERYNVGVSGMFRDCSSLTSVANLSLASLTHVHNMFEGCTSLISAPSLTNTGNITDARSMFEGCTALQTLANYNFSSVKWIDNYCDGCINLTSIPAMSLPAVTETYRTFYECYKVASGALTLYQQLSTKSTAVTLYSDCFKYCGRDTTTGAAELAQIPSSWGGTGA